MSTVSAGQSVQLRIGAFDGLWVNCSGVGFVDFECKSRGTIQLSTQYQRIGFYGEEICVELRCISGVIDYSTTPVAIEPLTAKQAGDNNDSSPLDLKLTVNRIASNKALVYTLGTIGDSRLANAYVQTGKQKQFQNQMVVTWLRALSGQRVDMPTEFSLAVSGSTTTQILAQANAMTSLVSKPDFCLINGGTNDFGSNPTLAGAMLALDNITNAASIIRQAGITPIIEIDVPRTTASWSASASTVSAEFNRMLREWCSENSVLLCDYEQMYIAPSTGEPASGFNVSDGIHPSSTGSSVRAAKYLVCIDSIIGKHTWRMASPRDTYNETLNPYGNMLANGLFTGTGGSSTGTGASGTVATSWQNRVISGTQTAVASKLTYEGSDFVSERQQVVVSFTTAGEYRLQPSGVGGGATAPAGVVLGDLLYAECDLEITALSGQISGISLIMFDFDGSSNISTVADFQRHFFPGNVMPVVPLTAPNGVGNIYSSLKMRLKTPAMVYGDGATPTQLNWRITVLGEAGASITFIVSNAQMRKA